ncbi:MAG: hypothetical protein GAK31_00625 [Stenotrophomonas maltophilia]|uniref:Uncharacterized protein n=1 Tax=Stenotrophomonas maltophilia TaxID=40324 RepID=A0A7V8FJT7_STEMA|nr:MAG: hypothetical protein GAK31_00625 [Stenotrophomonas maltophilia]
MQEFLYLAWVVLQAIGGIGAVVGFLAFLFREKIKHSLLESMHMRFEGEKAQLARDHARYSSELSRDAESHRVSLIVESERLRADQQIKTSLALRLAERRFESIFAVHAAVAGLPTTVRGYALTNFSGAAAEFDIRHARVHQMLEAAGDALKMNRAFIGSELFNAGLSVTSAVADVLGKRLEFADPALSAGAQEVFSLSLTYKEFERCLSLSLKPYQPSAW